jgi:hypothetical protein
MPDNDNPISFEPQPGLKASLVQGYRQTVGILHPAFNSLLEMIWTHIDGLPDEISQATTLLVRGALSRLVDISGMIGAVQNRIEPRTRTPVRVSRYLRDWRATR